IQESDDGPALLERSGTQLVLTIDGARYRPLLRRLGATGRWPCVYADGHHVVLASATSPATASLVNLAREGRLEYPSEGSRALSRAMFLLSAGAPIDTAAVIAAARESNAATPTPLGYQVIAGLSESPRFRDEALRYFDSESRRLGALPSSGKGSQQRRRSEIAIAQALSQLLADAGRRREAQIADERSQDLLREAERIRLDWN
ncbi:MAG: hypothetical protein ACRENS_04050, partial [Candidatus Eiseniibacteriota bacterium]